MTDQQLINLKLQLMHANVPLCEWGMNGCKTMPNLAKELDAGECTLEYRHGKMYRYIRVMLLDIIYHNRITGEKFRLIQKEQVASRGKTERIYGSSVSEKLKLGEYPDKKAVIRALHEELGIDWDGYYIEKQDPYLTLTKSTSYRGIATISTLYPCAVLLSDEQFNHDGYTETQDGITTNFVWEKWNAVDDNEYVIFKAGKD